jgi:DHA1 family bicyclomycin/chloramphenicol resistance-like MFS transporter
MTRKQSLMQYMLFLTTIFMSILGGAEVDLFIPSFPEIKRVFALTPFWVEALLSVNFIGYCLGLLFVGGLSDRYGRKPVILYGLVIFILGVVLCLKAPSYSFLLIGRFLQGIGVAAPAILSWLIITDAYPLKKQQPLIAILNGFMNTSVAAAPLAGSYITMYFHWQGNFMVLLLLGIATFLFTVKFVPATPPPKVKEPLSLKGYIPIFRSKFVMLLVCHMVLTSLPYWIFIGISPLLYMENLGVSLLYFGYYQGLWALTYALGSLASGLIIHRFDQKKMLFVSGLLCLMSLLIIATIAILDLASPLLIALAFLPYGLGSILPFTILYPICLDYMPQAKGRISALKQGSRLILTAIGLEVVGFFYVGSFQNVGIIITVIIALMILLLGIIINNPIVKEKLQTQKS